MRAISAQGKVEMFDMRLILYLADNEKGAFVGTVLLSRYAFLACHASWRHLFCRLAETDPYRPFHDLSVRVAQVPPMPLYI